MALDESSFANWSSKSSIERATKLHDLLVINKAMVNAVQEPGMEGVAALLEQANGILQESGGTYHFDTNGVILSG